MLGMPHGRWHREAHAISSPVVGRNQVANVRRCEKVGPGSKTVERRIDMTERHEVVPATTREMADQSFKCTKMAFRKV